MIEIDDAGTGDLVGDAFIGFYRKNNDELLIKTIPVQLFYEEPWKTKAPYAKAVELVKEAFKEMNVTPNELVKLCRGNIFDKVRSYFLKIEQYYQDAKIEGKLQDAVERHYINHLRKIGIRSRNLTVESGKKRYFILFDWVCKDFYKREKFVKSGFKKWKSTWRDKAIERFEKLQKPNDNSKKK